MGLFVAVFSVSPVLAENFSGGASVPKVEKDGLKYGLKDGLKNSLKDGAKNGQINGEKKVK